MIDRNTRHRLLAGLFVVIVVLTLFTGVGAAQSGVSGTTVVERGETVSSVSGVYGTIIVEGRVTGDVSGVAGNVVIRGGGVVEGNLETAAGNIRIAGTVEGSVSTGAGSVLLTDTGVVNGDFEVGAGDVRIDGTIQGDAQVGADTIRLGEQASIGGSLTYDGSLEGNRDAVAGEITRDRTLGGNIATDVQPVANWIFTINAFLLNLLFGVALLGLFPTFSTRVADHVENDPLTSGLIGVGTCIAVPILLVVIAITIIGIPSSLVGLLIFLVFAWTGLVYGRFAVGRWLLSFVDIDNKWAGLLVGLLLAVLLGQIPIVGGILNFAIFVLGVGAVVLGLVKHRQRIPDQPTQTTGGPVAE